MKKAPSITVLFCLVLFKTLQALPTNQLIYLFESVGDINQLMDTELVDSYSHISQIEIAVNRGHLHQFRINGMGDFIPNQGSVCSDSTPLYVMTLTPTQRITRITFTMDIYGGLEYWRKISFELNDGVSAVYDAPNPLILGSVEIVTYTVPNYHEIVGFQMRSRDFGNQCTNNVIRTYIRFDCTSPAKQPILGPLINFDGKSQQVFVDQAQSFALPINDVVTGLCGPIEYQISITPALRDLSLITINSSSSQLMVAQSLDARDIGSYEITIRASYQGFNTFNSPQKATFTYTDPCINPTLQPTLDISSFDGKTLQVFVGETSRFSFISNDLTSGFCGPINYQTSISPPLRDAALITINQVTKEIQVQKSQDFNDLGSYQVTIQAGYQGYGFTITRTATFAYTDPCLVTTIDGVSAAQTFVHFEGFTTVTPSSNQFADSMSILAALSPDICGNKEVLYEIDSLPTQILLGSNNEPITFAPNLIDQVYGTFTAAQIVKLQNYLSIPAFITAFDVTILASVKPIIPDQSYIISDEAFQFQVDTFSVLPQSLNADEIVSSGLQAFVLDGGCPVPSPFELTHYCLLPVSTQNWLNFFPDNSSFSVYANNSEFVGNKTVLVVQVFDYFPDVLPYVKFNIQLKQKVALYFVEPYFSTPLRDQSVLYCDGWNFWSYQLPKIIDEYNSTVQVAASLDGLRLAYDPILNVLSQTQALQFDQSFTVKFTLSNNLNLSKTYSMLIKFYCKKELAVPVKKDQPQQDQVFKQKQWPRAYIQRVDQDGLMHIKFTQKMDVPDHPEYIQNETININATDQPILRIIVVPGKYSKVSQLKFNWTFISFTPTELQIQLGFEDVNSVSISNKNPDAIFVQVFGFQLFSNERGEFMYPEFQLETKVLPQMDSKQRIQAARETSEMIQTALTVFITSSFVVTILVAGPIQIILDSVKSLQIMIHLMLVNLAYPATSTIFFGVLMQILNFQFYDFTNFYCRILKLDEAGQQPLTYQYGLLGYGSLYLILNFGTLFWLFFVTPIGWLSASFISLLNKPAFGWIGQRWSNKMFFNDWIGLFNDSYLFLGMCAAINFKYFHFDSYGNGINSALAAGFALILGAQPIIFGWFYRRFVDLSPKQKPRFVAKYGSGIEGLNFKRQGNAVLVYQCANMVRKSSLIFTVVYLQDYPIFSIFSINFSTILMIVIAGYTTPYTSQQTNHLVLINESFMFLATYHFYSFTDFMTDGQIRLYTGQSLVTFTILNVIICLATVAQNISSLVLRKLKLRYLAFKQSRKQNKLLMEQLEVIEQYEQTLKEKEGKRQIEIPSNTTKQLSQPKSKNLDVKAQNSNQIQKAVGNNLGNTEPRSRPVVQSQLFFAEPPILKPLISTHINTQIKQIALTTLKTRPYQSSQVISNVFLGFGKVQTEASPPVLKLAAQQNNQNQSVELKKFDHNDINLQLQKYLANRDQLPPYRTPRLKMKDFYLNQDPLTNIYECLEVKSAENEIIQVQEHVRNGFVNWITISVDGVQRDAQFVWPGSSDDIVEYERNRILVKVKELKSQIDIFTIEEIKSGYVEKILEQYEKEYWIAKKEQGLSLVQSSWAALDNRSMAHRVYSGLDFGPYSNSMDLESKVQLYKKIHSAKVLNEYRFDVSYV